MENRKLSDQNQQIFDDNNNICKTEMDQHEIEVYNKEKRSLSSFFKKLYTLSNLFIPNPTPTINNNCIISAITCHGFIPCDKNTFEPEMVEITDDIEIYKFTSSTPGVVGLETAITNDNNISVINSLSEQLLGPNIINMTSIMNEFKKYYRNKNSQELRELKKRKYDEDEKQFLYHSIKGYNNYRLTKGDKIVNKYFTRKISEKSYNDFSILEISQKYPESTQYPKIPLLPDLFTTMFGNNGLAIQDTDGKIEISQTISLNEIIKYYSSKGIKKLIIFDFTCSLYGIAGKEKTILEYLDADSQYVRLIRRNMCKNLLAYGGKKQSKNIKQKNKKTKTKKHKSKLSS
jgi:hypothetical protein